MIHGDWLSSWARVAPDKPAVIEAHSGRSYLYEELRLRSERTARMLQERWQIGPGARVAVMGKNRIEQLDLYFAVARLGAVLVPINWRLAPEEVAWILADCHPSCLIFGDDVSETVQALPGFAGWSGPCINLDDPGEAGWDARLASQGTGVLATPDINEDTPVLLLYTSGTTGRPKGAVLTHGTITWNAINTQVGWDLGHNDVTVTHTPLFHTGGWNVLTLPLLHRGGTVVLCRGFDPQETLDAIATHGVTVLFAVPTMFQMLLDHPHLETTDLGSIRFFISGGAPCPIPLIQAWQQRGVVFKQGYGLTEVGPNCFVLHERDAIRKAGSVGFPMLHLETRVVDGQDHRVKAGEVGELQLRGPTVCAGYFQNPEATAAALADNGWFATGDLFRVDEEGYHFVVGRKKEMFISGGENVYPAEVERVLHELPAVVEAAVIGVPDARWGEVGHAYVSLDRRSTTPPDPPDIQAHCRERLARYKVPKQVFILHDLPKGPSGKIQKQALRSMEESHAAHPQNRPA